MINDIKNGKYDGIIAYAPDRLARNMKEAGEMLDMVEDGIIKDLKFPTFHFERETNSMLSLGLNFLLAENYSTNLSYHTKSKRRDYKRRQRLKEFKTWLHTQ